MMFFKYLIKSLLLPPGLILVGVLFGVLVMRRWQRGGRLIVASSLALLLLLSVPAVSNPLYQSILKYEALPLDAPLAQVGAIVVLTGGSDAMAPEYGKDMASQPTVARARYGAFLHKRTGKPLLLAGGRPRATSLSEAETARQFLEQEMRTPVRWLDEDSKDTDDSSVNVMKILSGENIKNIVLVTSGFHMRRAVYLFEKVGFHVTPAPIGMRGKQPFKLYDMMPSAGALSMSSFVLNEWYGIWWYRLRNRLVHYDK